MSESGQVALWRLLQHSGSFFFQHGPSIDWLCHLFPATSIGVRHDFQCELTQQLIFLLKKLVRVESSRRKKPRLTSWHSRTTSRLLTKKAERLSAYFLHSLRGQDRHCVRAQLLDAFDVRERLMRVQACLSCRLFLVLKRRCLSGK